MAPTLSQANLYELTGKDTSVTYTPVGFGGAAQLNYRSGDQDQVYRGEQVRSQTTEIGTLVTVDVSFVLDGDTLTFSLFVPAVNLRNETVEAPVETVALLSTARSSIAGPSLVQGQLTTYAVIALAGTARRVDF